MGQHIDQSVVEYLYGLVGKTVLHTAYGVIGVVSMVFAPGEYIDKTGNPIRRHVIVLGEGHAFVAPTEKTTIVQLTEHEALVFAQLVDNIGTISIGAMRAIRSHPTSSSERMLVAVQLVRAALTAQVNALGS